MQGSSRSPMVERIAAAMAAAGGAIPFDRYMGLVLHEPGLGYYASDRSIFGPGGDFTTAPELTPLFGTVVARQVAAWLATGWPGAGVVEGGAATRVPAHDGVPPAVFEFGAGSGALAAAVLVALERFGLGDVEYRIVELSAGLRDRQRQAIAERAPGRLSRVRWLDRLPERIDGVVVANELLDAMPVRVFELGADATEPVELQVALAADGHGLEWRARPADAGLRSRVAALERATGPWPRPYRSEIGEQAEAWIRTVGASLRRGALLLFDYGFAAREFYHPQRQGGTLMSHRRHRADPDVLAEPGERDVTAHVDFSAIARAAGDVGLALVGYTAQARFLLNGGLLDDFAVVPREPLGDWARTAQAVQHLLSEAEMGESFKVVAFARGLGETAAWPGFAAGDRSGSLAGDDDRGGPRADRVQPR